MEKIINSSIYVIYIIIASISVVISYKISIVMSLIVVAIEYVRLIGIYKRKYGVICLIFIMNLGLVGYNSYKSQNMIESKNKQIEETNKTISKYIATKDLRAKTLQELKGDIKEIKEVEIDWWLLVLVYVILELSLVMLLLGINKENKQGKVLRDERNRKIVEKRPLLGKEIAKGSAEVVASENEELEYVGSYIDYAKQNKISVRKAGALFSDWRSEGRLVKKEGKNYIRR